MAAIALAGCAPEHNWREVPRPELGLVVLLPGRPSTMTRTLAMAGQSVRWTMIGARAQDVAYTVATACLPDDQREQVPVVLAAMRAHMVRNIAGREYAARQVAVPGATLAHEIAATGHAQGQPVVLRARFVAAQNCVWQAVVLGPTPPEHEAALFLGSLRVQP